MNDLKRLEPRTSAAKVYDQVRLMAVTFQFRPGERINEVELARQLNVSRTPLREALNRLASEGFVTSIPSRGVFGRMLDVDEICALYEFRWVLEEAVIRLACERATDAQLNALEAWVLDTASGPGQLQIEHLQSDEEFHLRLADLAGNPELRRALDNVNGRIQFVRWIDLRQRGRSEAGHRRIIELLRARDPDRCAAHIGAMFRRRRGEIVEVIRTGIADIYLRPVA